MAEKLTAKEIKRDCPNIIKGQKWLGVQEKYNFICPVHGVFTAFYKSVRTALYKENGNGCLKCQHESIRQRHQKSIANIKKRFPDLVDGQSLLPGIGTTRPKYRFLCPVGHGEYLRTVNSRQQLQGSGCIRCGREKAGDARRLTIKQVEDRNPDMVKGQLWVNAGNKYWFNCSKHGQYRQVYSYHNGGSGCPRCKRSKSEAAIERWLNTRVNGRSFESQKRFKDCRLKKPLAFDFISTTLKMAIEYNGAQHYSPGRFYGFEISRAQFNLVRKRDRIKRLWLRKNGFRLVIIDGRKYSRLDSINSYLEKYLGNVLPPLKGA